MSLTVAWLHILKMEETVVLGCKIRYPLHSSQLMATLPSLSILYIHVRVRGQYKVEHAVCTIIITRLFCEHQSHVIQRGLCD